MSRTLQLGLAVAVLLAAALAPGTEAQAQNKIIVTVTGNGVEFPQHCPVIEREKEVLIDVQSWATGSDVTQLRFSNFKALTQLFAQGAANPSVHLPFEDDWDDVQDIVITGPGQYPIPARSAHSLRRLIKFKLTLTVRTQGSNTTDVEIDPIWDERPGS